MDEKKSFLELIGIRKSVVSDREKAMAVFRRATGNGNNAEGLKLLAQGALITAEIIGAQITYKEDGQNMITSLASKASLIRETNETFKRNGEEEIRRLESLIAEQRSNMAGFEKKATEEIGVLDGQREEEASMLTFFAVSN